MIAEPEMVEGLIAYPIVSEGQGVETDEEHGVELEREVTTA